MRLHANCQRFLSNMPPERADCFLILSKRYLHCTPKEYRNASTAPDPLPRGGATITCPSRMAHGLISQENIGMRMLFGQARVPHRAVAFEKAVGATLTQEPCQADDPHPVAVRS
jgi:hypothetical protein